MPTMEDFDGLSDLFLEDGWGSDPEYLEAALDELKAHPILAQQRLVTIGMTTAEQEGGSPLQHLLAYRNISTQQLEYVLGLYPQVLQQFDFLHWACATEGVTRCVIKFFVQKCQGDISKVSTMSGLEGYPISLYWHRVCDGPVLLADVASCEYWKEVKAIFDLLWIDGEDDFVDVAVEKECWPLVSYFANKNSQKYWTQKDPDEAWKHNPPGGTLTAGALDIIDQVLLPKFPRKSCELELPGHSWHSQEILFPWIQNKKDLRLLYLHATESENPPTIPPRFTDALFRSLAKNQSLEDFRMSGNFHTSWTPFARLLQKAPPDFLTCNLTICQDVQIPGMNMFPLTSHSSLRKLDLFRIKIEPKRFETGLIPLLITLPHLQDLEIVLDVESDLARNPGFNLQDTTSAIVLLLEKERLQRLTFGPCPLGLMPMCKLLKKNQSLQMLKCYFKETKSADFQCLLDVMKNQNRTLQKYGSCDFALPLEGTDTSMGGLRKDFLFYTRLNRIDRQVVLGSPQATIHDLIPLLTVHIGRMLKEDVELGVLGSEVPYCFELLRQCPLLWTGPSLGEGAVRTGRKRKLESVVCRK